MNIAELSRDNPELLALEEAYSKLNLFEQSLWETWSDHIDIQKFRGEPGYLSQKWMMTEERYRNTLHYALDMGLRHDIETLGEDEAFGCITYREDMGASEDDIIYSRDLLDSVFEIQFLEETLQLRSLGMAGPVVLDIGAGYGRFAHRLVQKYPFSACVTCVDAVPLSTFLCEFYLGFRGINSCTRSVPLHQLQGLVWPFNFACNMYSFSEMPLSAVHFWLGFCADLQIPYFYLVPHAPDLVHPHFLTSEPDGSHLDYLSSFPVYGYKLETRRPKFPVGMSDKLIYNTEYWLFRRT